MPVPLQCAAVRTGAMAIEDERAVGLGRVLVEVSPSCEVPRVVHERVNEVVADNIAVFVANDVHSCLAGLERSRLGERFPAAVLVPGAVLNSVVDDMDA